MKRFFIFLLLFSSHSMADNAYIGLGLTPFNNSELSGTGSYDDTGDIGFNGFVGYSVTKSPGLELGIELELQQFDKIKDSIGDTLEGQAYYINLRPKWVEEGNHLYSALVVGLGSMSSEVTVSGVSIKESSLSYQVGFEIGYMIENLDIGLGYRYQTSDHDQFDVTQQGAVLNFRYNF